MRPVPSGVTPPPPARHGAGVFLGAQHTWAVTVMRAHLPSAARCQLAGGRAQTPLSSSSCSTASSVSVERAGDGSVSWHLVGASPVGVEFIDPALSVMSTSSGHTARCGDH